MKSILINYKNFLLENKAILGAGFLLVCFGYLTQTAFIGIFTSYIKQDFLLNNTQLGNIYSIANIVSSTSLIIFAKLINKIKISYYSLGIALLFSMACFLFAESPSKEFLLIAFVLLRFFGYGLMMHLVISIMNKIFKKNKGKAISISLCGMIFTYSIFSLLATHILNKHSWRNVWIVFGILSLIIFCPLIYFLSKKFEKRFYKQEKNSFIISEPLLIMPNMKIINRRRDVLKDYKFYPIAAMLITIPLVNISCFYFQHELVAFKHWDFNWFINLFLLLSITTVISSFLSGFLIDRFTAIRILPFYLIPMFISCLIMLFFKSLIIAYIFIIGVGISNGMATIITSTALQECYQSTNPSSIQSLPIFLISSVSAFFPTIIGKFFDMNFSFNNIFQFLCIWIFLLVLINYFIFYVKFKPLKSNV